MFQLFRLLPVRGWLFSTIPSIRRLEFLDAFQQTAILADYLGARRDAAKMYADWLLLPGENLKIRQLPTEIWQAIQRKSTYWSGICQHLREP